MAADSEIAIFTTKHMAGTGAAPFVNYLGRLVALGALVLTALANFQVVGYPEVVLGPNLPWLWVANS